ncbi:hypothetical protein GOBAR_AA12615 [Gossypium barbadense]|uniref:SWIM-type domain-containing protein n=1 Tax=Gossypium barbadense TaxID=3634 RepID=A0A2P5XXE6_GOSBA|nr:hypothetical protein GOBAR_AA12615 [Gossypium barbadense]
MEYVRLDQDMLGASYRVHLLGGTCDCERFQALWFPCMPVIVVYMNLQIEYMLYINYVYRLKCMHSVWSFEFLTIPDERTWPPMSSMLYELSPNMNLCRVPKGRSNSTRICTYMDI